MSQRLAPSLRHSILLAAAVCMASASSVEAQTYASPERTSVALGHYARSRALLVEALAEFERGRSMARPDTLIDPEEWRINIVSRAEELNRILDPKPRVTRNGARFKASPALIRRDSEYKTPVPQGPKDANYYGEDERAKNLRQESNDSQPKITDIQTKATNTQAEKVATTATNLEKVMQNHAAVVADEKETTPELQPEKPAVLMQPAKRPILTSPSETSSETDEGTKLETDTGSEAKTAQLESSSPKTSQTEDKEISEAIEAAIKARLQKFNSLKEQQQ